MKPETQFQSIRFSFHALCLSSLIAVVGLAGNVMGGWWQNAGIAFTGGCVIWLAIQFAVYHRRFNASLEADYQAFMKQKEYERDEAIARMGAETEGPGLAPTLRPGVRPLE